MERTKYNITKITEQDLDKYVHLNLQVAELLLLQNLLADASMGMLPLIHTDDKHHSFYVQFFKYLDVSIGEVLKNDK